ncbi:MAG TPA: 3-hydroxyacyl-CoA dehydrogenase family protein, partial [Galbitalea sp.]
MMSLAIPGTVGVLGGGRMGAGIAHAFLLAGAAVVILERDQAAADDARAALDSAVAKSIDRGWSGATCEQLGARISTTTDPVALVEAGLVVEAVPEDLAMKTELLVRVEAALAVDAWLVSNTSSLSIDLLAASLRRPERFCGLHFFNPVPVSSLVEIVRGSRTSEDLVAAASSWVTQLGKTPIVVKDSPGFASSRLGVAIALEAIRMLEEGVASASDIDAAMVLGYRFPIGPLRLTDEVGLDVRLAIAEHLNETLGERFAVPQLLRELVAAGKL